MSAKKLSNGEKKVVNAWNGSIKETAAACGLSYGYVRNVVTKDYILAAIQAREEKENASGKNPLIADRQERQAFWSSVMRGDPQIIKIEEDQDDEGQVVKKETKEVPVMANRLKAAELLGKSNADFIEKTELPGPGGGPREFNQPITTVEEV